MLFGLSVLALCSGVLFAIEAVRRPLARGILEGVAGSLIVGGLGLLGNGLHAFP